MISRGRGVSWVSLAYDRDMVPELHSVPFLFKVAVPECDPGIYFLVRNRKVVYVGQSVTPLERLMSHKREGVKEFDSVYFQPTRKADLALAEMEFIKNLRPEYNIVGVSGRKRIRRH